MYKLKECPTAHIHVIYGILNVVNVVKHYLVMERLIDCPGVDLIFHLLSYC